MVKKVLLCLPEGSSFYPGVYRAFSYLGYEVRNFDFRKFSVNEKILAISGQQQIAYSMLNQRLYSIVSAWKPDLFLVFKGETISHETLAKIRTMGVKVVNWFPDGLWKLDLILDIVSDYDIFFHFDSLVVEVLKKRGQKNVFYLPYAADIIPSDEDPGINFKTYPVTFIGNYYPEREDYFVRIASPEFYLWGEKKWKDTRLASNYHGVIQYSRVKNILSKTDICVNLHYQQAKSNGVNLRVYESTAAAVCLLTDYKKDLVKMYRIGEEIVTYKGIDDFLGKLQFLKANIKMARNIGKHGYLRTKREHTYTHRIKEILKNV